MLSQLRAGVPVQFSLSLLGAGMSVGGIRFLSIDLKQSAAGETGEHFRYALGISFDENFDAAVPAVLPSTGVIDHQRFVHRYILLPFAYMLIF